MRKITIIQQNALGAGQDRTQVRWVKQGQVALKVRDIERAYNMDNTEIVIG